MAVALSVGIASCDDDEAPEYMTTYENYRTDIVTYEGSKSQTAQFTYWGRGDSTAISITANDCTPQETKIGERVLLRYRITEQTCDHWNAQAYNCSKILSDSLRVNIADLDNYKTWRVRLNSLWRTGDYINLNCQLEYTGEKRAFYLMVDKNTVKADTAHCYLIHDLLDAHDIYFWRDCIASFYVGQLWKVSPCNTLCIHVNDVNFPQVKQYYFNRKQ
ncbi:MAG: hypothetical protein IK092_04300 [Muribaculaceae bacterium]|nr:hypothetical protein [Muribaculaceae bacterium]